MKSTCKVQQCLMVFCVSKFQKNGRICGFHGTFGSKKCFSFRGLRPPDQGLCPWTPLEAPPPGPPCRLTLHALAMAPLDCGPPAGGKLTKWPAVSKWLDSTVLDGTGTHYLVDTWHVLETHLILGARQVLQYLDELICNKPPQYNNYLMPNESVQMAT